MARTTEKPAETDEAIDRGEEYVDLMIPMTSPDDKPVFIGVNGESVCIRPGEVVQVKRKFAEVWKNSMRQKNVAMQTQRRAQEASRKALADL